MRVLKSIYLPGCCHRWDVEATTTLADGIFPVRFGSLLSSAEAFDSEAFGISDAEATAMDPQQRLLLECAGEVLTGGLG